VNWRMPSETHPHERTWMAFPHEGPVLGGSEESRTKTYGAWADVANAIADFEPVAMLVDPSELRLARAMLSSEIELFETAIDECWLRDHGPTFVIDEERPGQLGVVDWVFNGWGAHAWSRWEHANQNAGFVADLVRATRITSMMVNEGGGIHVDGEGTVLLTETVQLDPRRNPYADKERIEAELARTIGSTKAIWLPRGLARDYADFGTSGHVDILAAITSPGHVLVHVQTNPEHPDYEVSQQLHDVLSNATDAAGRQLQVTALPAPATLRDEEGFVDYSYVNHAVVNDGIIACGFGEPTSDARAREILEAAYPGRRAVTVEARHIFAQGGGIHCITQQQPRVDAA